MMTTTAARVVVGTAEINVKLVAVEMMVTDSRKVATVDETSNLVAGTEEMKPRAAGIEMTITADKKVVGMMNRHLIAAATDETKTTTNNSLAVLMTVLLGVRSRRVETLMMMES